MSNFRNANNNFYIRFTDFEYEYFQNLKQKSKIKKIKTFILNKIFTATIIEIDLDFLKKDKEKGIESYH